MKKGDKGIQFMLEFHGFHSEVPSDFTNALLRSFCDQYVFYAMPLPIMYDDTIMGNQFSGFVTVLTDEKTPVIPGLSIFPYCYKIDVTKRFLPSTSVQTTTNNFQLTTINTVSSSDVDKSFHNTMSAFVRETGISCHTGPGTSETIHINRATEDNEQRDRIVPDPNTQLASILRNARPLLPDRHTNIRNKLDNVLKQPSHGSIAILTALTRNQVRNLNRITADCESMKNIPQMHDDIMMISSSDDITSFIPPDSQNSERSCDAVVESSKRRRLSLDISITDADDESVKKQEGHRDSREEVRPILNEFKGACSKRQMESLELTENITIPLIAAEDPPEKLSSLPCNQKQVNPSPVSSSEYHDTFSEPQPVEATDSQESLIGSLTGRFIDFLNSSITTIPQVSRNTTLEGRKGLPRPAKGNESP